MNPFVVPMLYPQKQKAPDFNEIKGFPRWPTRTPFDCAQGKLPVQAPLKKRKIPMHLNIGILLKFSLAY